jgi:hypothetical protein
MSDLSGSAGEREEHRLERILRVLRVTGEAPANGQNHRAVSPDQERERTLVLLGDERLDQLTVRTGPEIDRDADSGKEN